MSSDPTMIQFEDDNVTLEDFNSLLGGEKLDPGTYEFEVVEYNRYAPTDERAGGDYLKCSVIVGPGPAPTGGWPMATVKARKHQAPSEQQLEYERWDKADMARLMRACGVEFQGNWPEALTACKGRRFVADVVVKNDFVNLKKFRPAS